MLMRNLNFSLQNPQQRDITLVTKRYPKRPKIYGLYMISCRMSVQIVRIFVQGFQRTCFASAFGRPDKNLQFPKLPIAARVRHQQTLSVP
jgi:hypothetical protein